MSPITRTYNRDPKPTTVLVRYSVPHPEAVFLEGVPVLEHVQKALAAAQVHESADARLVLAVNAPGAATAPADLQPHRDVETHDRDLSGFVDALAGDARAGRRIAVVDLAYVGGPEHALEELLSRARLGDAVATTGHLRGASHPGFVLVEVLRELADAAPESTPATPAGGSPSGRTGGTASSPTPSTSPSVDFEIAEQPSVLQRLLARPGWDELAARVAARAPQGALTVARGSSDHAATFFSYLVWTLLERPAASVPPSVATLYDKRPLGRGQVAIGISQSGESPDVVRGLEAVRAGGAYSIAVTNVPGSSLTRAADETIDLACGSERAVAATKTFSASLAALLALAVRWAGRRDLVESLARIPAAAERALARPLAVSDVVEIARPHESKAPSVFVLGRGFTLPLAQEAALKLKEVARVRAEALSTHEFIHGPIGALEPGAPVLVVLPRQGPVRESCQSVLEKLAASGARPVIFEGPADLPEETGGVPLAISLQRLAVAVARARGLDPDRPKNITKVTKTW